MTYITKVNSLLEQDTQQADQNTGWHRFHWPSAAGSRYT